MPDPPDQPAGTPEWAELRHKVKSSPGTPGGGQLMASVDLHYRHVSPLRLSTASRQVGNEDDSLRPVRRKSVLHYLLLVGLYLALCGLSTCVMRSGKVWRDK